MAGHPLRPATRRRLGTPSPHQQADRPRAHPRPEPPLTRWNLSVIQEAPNNAHPVLASVSRGYPRAQGRLLTCYSPVRRSTIHPKADASLDLHVLSTPPAFVLSQDQTLQQGKKNPAKKQAPHHNQCTNTPKKTPAHPSNAEPNKHTPKNRAHKHSHRHAVEFSKNTPTPAPSTQPGHQKGINQTVTTKLTEPHSPTTTGGPPKRTPPAEPTDPTTQFNSPTPQPTSKTTDRSQRKPTLNHAEKPNPTGGVPSRPATQPH